MPLAEVCGVLVSLVDPKTPRCSPPYWLFPSSVRRAIGQRTSAQSASGDLALAGVLTTFSFNKTQYQIPNKVPTFIWHTPNNEMVKKLSLFLDNKLRAQRQVKKGTPANGTRQLSHLCYVVSFHFFPSIL